ncbi:MAG: RcnB family protein [Betaproteobacteria bacterium]|nr:RcnB family protein [Betaproteobacteria bacterium]
MTKINRKVSLRLAALGVALALTAGGAFADKPNWAGNGKHEEERARGDRNDDERRGSTVTFSFGSDDRRIVSEYYGAQMRKGKCPPGLAKKHNGCQPPGQAKKWHRGQPLANDIRYYELPKRLRVRLPAPPPNHRYVQVAGDILLIAVGSSIVVDAIEDILR